jgi:CxxC motif-containing protein (DUF1111 family)
MKRPSLAWFLVIALLAVAPAGLRVLSWRAPKQEVDPEMARAGEVLFKHVWTAGDPLTAGGDGLGPVFNAKSCVACHQQGGVGGSGGVEHNVTVFTVRATEPNGQPRQGVVHKSATRREFLENVSLVNNGAPAITGPSQLAGRSRRPVMSSSHCAFSPSSTAFSERNTPALFGDRLIDAIPDRDIIAQERREQLRAGLASSDDDNTTVGRAARLAGGRIGKFGWKAQTASLSDFVQAACANELGLGNPGQAQPRSLARPVYEAPGLDLTLEQCNQLTAYVASLPRPVERAQASSREQEAVEIGKQLFTSIGCADCHTPSLGAVDGLYSDLLLHRMGQELVGGGSYNEPRVPLPDFPSSDTPQPGEWRTPPLWGVADSAPYLHDGRAGTLDEAIRLHGGQGSRSRDRYTQLPDAERAALLAFLQTLHAPDAY